MVVVDLNMVVELDGGLEEWKKLLYCIDFCKCFLLVVDFMWSKQHVQRIKRERNNRPKVMCFLKKFAERAYRSLKGER